MAANILVIAEHRDGKLKGISKEAMTLGRELAPQMGGELEVVVLGQGIDAIAQELVGWGATRVLTLDDAGLEPYTPEAYVAVLRKLIEQRSPGLVLVGHSYQAMDFYPRLAAALDVALIPDVTAVVLEDGRPVFTRKVLNGKLDSKVTPTVDGPWLASLQQGAFPAGETGGSASPIEAIEVDLAGVTPRKVLKIEEAEMGEVDLSAADVIVAGGRGVGGKEKFEKVFELAELLGAAVGASRPPCDAEWVEHQRQIGSSGQVVAPKLYFALGISGAIQHLVGMRGAQCIVAVNKDPNAAIFQEATYGIVTDLHELLPELIEAIREAQEG